MLFNVAPRVVWLGVVAMGSCIGVHFVFLSEINDCVISFVLIKVVARACIEAVTAFVTSTPTCHHVIRLFTTGRSVQAVTTAVDEVILEVFVVERGHVVVVDQLVKLPVFDDVMRG